MTGFRCGCGPAIDCTYPECKEGVEMSQSITQMLRDYARDYTTTTYHDALICKAATEIEFHEERWDQLRQQLDALRGHQVAYETETEQELASRDAEIERLKTVPMRYRRMAFNAQLQNENTQLCQQLAAAHAACKLKDEAISDFLKQYPHMTKGYVLDALAIQPDDDALKAWIGEPVAWMITYDGKCMGFVPTEEANTVAVYSPKGLK